MVDKIAPKVNLNAQRLPAASYTDAKLNQAVYVPPKVGVVQPSGVADDPFKDEFSEENMQNPQIALANQKLIAETQRRATLIRQGITTVGVMTLGYFALIRKTGPLSIRKYFIKHVDVNNAEKLKKYTDDLLDNIKLNGFLKPKEIKNKIPINFSETGIDDAARKEAVENIYKVAKQASLMDDFISTLEVRFTQGSKEEITNVVAKLKDGKINEIPMDSLKKIEKITFIKEVEKNNKITAIIVDAKPRNVVDASNSSEAFEFYANRVKQNIRNIFVS